MKKTLALLLVAAAIAGAIVAVAAETPIRDSKAVVGSTNHTNTIADRAILPVRIDAFNWLPVSDTVTVTRIRGLQTNTLTSFTVSSGAGAAAAFGTNWLYMIPADVYRITSSREGTGTVAITAHVQN